ncbi:hypothetical protein PspR84_28500 [Pseudomonas sp. R84]|nr:hypothetical protein PspR84_28500 [Pseudomonas sp. R84]
MMQTNIEWLESLETEELKEIIEKLNYNGRVTDQCGVGISSTIIEEWSCDDTNFLRKHGYTGGSLTKTTEVSDGVRVYVLQ